MLGELLQAFAREVEIREINVPMQNQQQQQQQRIDRQPSSSKQSKKIGTASALFTGRQSDGKKNFPFCQEEHYAEDCSRYESLEERKHILSKYT